MDADTTAKKRFGERLRDARQHKGYSSASSLADELVHRGVKTTGANVRGWENGSWAPSSRTDLAVLEEIVGTNGELAAILGYAAGETIEQRVDDLAAAVAELAERMADLTRLVENTGRGDE